MNKRYLNGLLLAFLLLIWGGVIYKFFGKAKHNTAVNTVSNVVAHHKPKYTANRDTFKLDIKNKNPFKTSRYYVETNKNTPQKSKKSVKKTTALPIKWPSITYHGFVKSPNKSKMLILVKVDQKVYRKREKDVVKDIKLEKAYSDSLVVSFQKKTKTVKKYHE